MPPFAPTADAPRSPAPLLFPRPLIFSLDAERRRLADLNGRHVALEQRSDAESAARREALRVGEEWQQVTF